VTVNLKLLWQRLLSKDLYTWLGHGAMGFLLTLIAGPAFTAGAFVYREASDLIEWKFDDRPMAPTRDYVDEQYKRWFSRKIRDGFGDLFAPLLGAALAVALRSVL